jgi:hypothetical protein
MVPFPAKSELASHFGDHIPRRHHPSRPIGRGAIMVFCQMYRQGSPRVERNFANFRRNSAVADQGKPMARNFGVPTRSARYQPGAFWPLLPLAFIVVGLISALAHLR